MVSHESPKSQEIGVQRIQELQEAMRQKTPRNILMGAIVDALKSLGKEEKDTKFHTVNNIAESSVDTWPDWLKEAVENELQKGEAEKE